MDSSPENPPARLPVACTLTTKAAAEQALEWIDLQEHATAVVALDAGVRMSFPASLVREVEDLAQRERDCCAFLTITTSVLDETLTLEVTSNDPEALPVIAAMAGLPLP